MSPPTVDSLPTARTSDPLAAAPMLPIAIGLIAGVVVDARMEVAPAVSVSAFFVSALAVWVTGRRAYLAPICLVFASVAVGAFIHGRSERTIPADSVERLATTPGTILRIRGRVVGAPQQLTTPEGPFRSWSYGSARTGFLLHVQGVEGTDADVRVSGLIRVTVHEGLLAVADGESVELFGWLYALTGPVNPGGFDWRGFYRRQGVVARFVCDGRLNVRRLESNAPPMMTRVLNALRSRARAYLVDDLASSSTEESSLLEAMVLGHRSQFDRRLNEIFTRAGVIHFIAVSGTNVVVLMSFGWFVGRMLRRSKRQCVALMLVIVVTYALVAEPRPPILRATVMGVLFCLSLWIQRSPAHLNWLSVAAAALILIDPGTVFDVGFQLSFVAVLGVAYLAPALIGGLSSGWNSGMAHVFDSPFAVADNRLARFAAWSRSPTRRWIQTTAAWAWRTVWTVLLVSVAAWLIALPIVTTYFLRIQPWGPVSTAIVFPLMSVIMILGIVRILLSFISPMLSGVVGAGLTWLDSRLIALVERLAALPAASVTTPPPPVGLVVLFYAFLLFFVWSFHPKAHFAASRRRGVRMVTLALGIGSAVGAVAHYRPTPSHDDLRIHVLSVGRGSATVIELPDGSAVMYDAGSSMPGDAGHGVILPFLAAKGIRRLEHVYISHPNLDHFSGLPTVPDDIDAGPVILNRCFEPKADPHSPSRRLLKILRERGQAIETLDPSLTAWSSGGVRFELLWPLADCDASMSDNDASTVLRITFSDRSILLPGDIEERTQRELLRRGDLHADVLLLPHHGGICPTTRAFIEAVNPSVVVRSSHERIDETINGIDDLVGEIPFYSTADVGSIEVVLNADGVHVTTQFARP